MKEQSDTPRQTPLVELLLAVPEDARLIYEHSPTESQSIPVGPMCRQAAMELATATRERDEARAALAKFLEWLEKDEAGPQYSMPAGREGPDGEAEWRRWWHGQLDLCAQSLELARKALAATEAKP